jgi:hypothetical protein
MKFTKFRAFPVCLLGLLLAVSSRTIAAERAIIPPGQSIAEAIKNALAAGDQSPGFSLHAERAGSETDYEVNVRVATPAVTSATIVSVLNGEGKHVDEDDVATMLVSDEAGVLALIAVDKKDGSTNGIVQRNGEKMKLVQNGKGGKVRLEREGSLSVSCYPFPLSRLNFYVAYLDSAQTP